MESVKTLYVPFTSRNPTRGHRMHRVVLQGQWGLTDRGAVVQLSGGEVVMALEGA